MSCMNPFYISFFERSGSTFLVDLLDSHPDVTCAPEVFHEFRTDNSWARRPDLSTRQTVRVQLDQIYADSSRACGFKFKYPLQYELYPDLYTYLLEKKEDLRVIYLYRRNLLKAAISKQNQQRLIGMGKSSNLTKTDFVELGQVHLDIDRALHYMEVRQAYDRQYYDELRHFKHTYVLSYEELLVDTKAVMDDVFRFLEVDPSYRASTKMMKITEDDVKKAVANYEELLQRIVGTPYEEYLGPVDQMSPYP